MAIETRTSDCHIRIYNSDGIVITASPRMDANDLAHIVLDIIKEHETEYTEA